MHPYWQEDAILTVYCETALDNVNDLAVMGDRYGAGLVENTQHIIFFYQAITDAY
jgi:hypothetical protein